MLSYTTIRAEITSNLSIRWCLWVMPGWFPSGRRSQQLMRGSSELYFWEHF
jgi:hypothetical protein